MKSKTYISKVNYLALPGLKPGVYLFNPRLDAIHILKIVEEEFSITYKEMASIHRFRRFVEARMVAIFLIRKFTNLTLFEISHMFGGRDHTTAIHSIQRVNDLISTEPEFKNRLLSLENKLS